MSKEKSSILMIHPRDHVAVALRPLQPGEILALEDGRELTVREQIPAGHKIACAGRAPGQPVVKYGAPIGYAAEAISAGAWVHTHNLKSGLSGKLQYRYEPETPPAGPALRESFLGYPRPDGRAGTRNELWIIPTVGCVSQTCQRLRDTARRELEGYAVDGIHCLDHRYGCAQLGDDMKNTQQFLKALVNHPNAGGVLVVGLGCEYNHLELFKTVLGRWDSDRVKFLNCQTEDDEMEAGAGLLRELAEYAGQCRRVPVSMDRLVLGLKCGGSDAFSGITANPLMGRMADRVADCGGAALLTEVPEMFGAETRLMARAASREVYEDIVTLINDFKQYYMDHGQTAYENPSPGNREGGITTLEEKSLGCTYKGGSRAVGGVLRYAQSVDSPGLLLVEAPGYDLVSATALMAAGAQIILFSTGRGNPWGTYVPTLKISSNTSLGSRKPHWIDYDAGRLARGYSMDEAADELWALLKDTASGREALNEVNGYRDMAIFKTGITV